MDAMKQIYLLLICHGFYLGSVCQRWTFPSKITALIGSCVEIPCTYHPAESSGVSSPVWYTYSIKGNVEILNTKDSSSVRINYKYRTSLVPGNNSCSLRIDPVRRENGGEYYYPGIAEDGTINAFDKQARFLIFSITDAPTEVLITLKNESEFTELICDFLRSRPDVTHYTWMKEGSILQSEIGKTLTIDNNGKSYGRYSCIAHNSVGESTSDEIYHKGSFPNRYRHIIIPATIVTICLALLLYACWRNKHKKLEPIETEATYTDLITSEITETYDQLKNESSYTDLIRSEITETYDELKIVDRDILSALLPVMSELPLPPGSPLFDIMQLSTWIPWRMVMM
ncbi:Schwann cell myelin protein-like [Phyllobates terribilis]|uniref:Schwann cell myelin protein-like n=1 Tax=Phyllobates terribilis TaxID=111132 RepID=UPI003CCAAF0B